MRDAAAFSELAQLLYDQAALSEGGQLVNPADYVRRLNRLLVRLAVPAALTSAAFAAESLVLRGPAGDLEARLDFPPPAPAVDPAAPAACAVVCHPHPLFGGTLSNKVVHTLARTFNDAGMPSLRFNFRGVGASAGTHDGGPGEVQDALAAVRYCRERWPQARLWLAGFSFGAAVAIRASMAAAPAGLVAVAPAVDRMDIGAVTPAVSG